MIPEHSSFINHSIVSAVLYLRTNSYNSVYTGVPYRGIGKYSDCLLLLSLRCCTSPHLHRHRSLMCGTGKLSAQSHNFWLFALPDCSKSHICHPTDNSSVCRDGFGHSSPLSQNGFPFLEPAVRASSRMHQAPAFPFQDGTHISLFICVFSGC